MYSNEEKKNGFVFTSKQKEAIRNESNSNDGNIAICTQRMITHCAYYGQHCSVIKVF